MASQKRAKRMSKTRRRTEARRQERAAYRAAEAALEADSQRFYSDVFGPESSAERAAQVLHERLEGRPVPGNAVELFLLAGSRNRAGEVAGELLTRYPGSLTALTLAADVAHALDQDKDRAAELLDEAAKIAVEPDHRVELAEHFGFAERVAEGLDIVEPLRAERADDLATTTVYARLLDLAEARARRARLADAEAEATVDGTTVVEAVIGEAADGDTADVEIVRRGEWWLPTQCPCRSGDLWQDCCRSREEAALRRFDDRTRFEELRAALARHVEGDPTLAGIVAGHVEQWLDLLPEVNAEERQLVTALATEHAWVVGDAESSSDLDDLEPGDDDEEGEDEIARPVPLASFAAHQDTPPADAAAVRVWDRMLDYGLWMVVDPDSGPGLWVVDILSGARRYISVPAADRARVVRWSVLLGAVAYTDGVWRTGAALIHLSPAEGDMVAELAARGIETLGRSLAGGRNVTPRSLPTPGRQAPAGVAATATEYELSGETDLLAKLFGVLLPGMIGAVFAWRKAGPDLLNTDGDGVRLIEASLQVGDAEQARGKLMAHPDIDPDEDRGGLVWWGAELTEDERQVMRVAARQMSGDDLDLDLESRRWLRGRVGVGHDTLELEVNSAKRLAEFVDVLRTVGFEATIVSQRILEPQFDLHLRRGMSLPNRAMSQAEIEDFEDDWPDADMPGIPGRSARRALKRPENLPVVESALRELEHDAARRFQAGLIAPDVEVIRDALGMPADVWLNRAGQLR